MRRALATPLVLLAVVLSGGCVDESADVGAETDGLPDSREQDATRNQHGMAAGEAVGGEGLLPVSFSDCIHWLTTVLVPSGTFSPSLPPGWSHDPGTADLAVEFLTCNRVSWGAFERGPVRMILELHENFIAPAACLEAASNTPAMVSGLWMDDADLVAAAQSSGLPAQHATITLEEDSTGSLRTLKASISGGGGASAEFFAGVATGFENPKQFGESSFVVNDTTLILWEASLNYNSLSSLASVAHGQFGKGFVAGSIAQGTWLTGTTFVSERFSRDIRFTDLGNFQCE